MPLHADRVTTTPRDADRLNRAIGRHTFRDQARGQPVNSLIMQGVHRDLRRAREFVQPAIRGNAHAVGFALADFGGRMHGRGMVDPVRQILQTLMQGPAEGHIQFLKSAANGQQWHPPRHGGPDQRQCHVVAVRVLPRAFSMRRTIVKCRMNVGSAAGQDDTVETVQ